MRRTYKDSWKQQTYDHYKRYADAILAGFTHSARAECLRRGLAGEPINPRVAPDSLAAVAYAAGCDLRAEKEDAP